MEFDVTLPPPSSLTIAKRREIVGGKIALLLASEWMTIILLITHLLGMKINYSISIGLMCVLMLVLSRMIPTALYIEKIQLITLCIVLYLTSYHLGYIHFTNIIYPLSTIAFIGSTIVYTAYVVIITFAYAELRATLLSKWHNEHTNLQPINTSDLLEIRQQGQQDTPVRMYLMKVTTQRRDVVMGELHTLTTHLSQKD